MNSFKFWLKKNWTTIIFGGLVIILFVSPDSKAWLMRQMISTGLFNSKIEEQKSDNIIKVSENFSVKAESGIIINTSELKGKVVFINFWASWCPPCRAEFPSVQKLYEKYSGNKNLVFLTINLDDQVEKGKMYLEKEEFTVPFLIPNGNIPKDFFGGSLPTTVVLDKSGKIRMHHTGMADYSKESFYEEINQLLKE
ncbi:TlpA family protein disulfide reductase [Chryseobacterium aquaticum]|uniref:Thioredoxin n=1 Tax=Chryseobacterium aquaticum subsp. greenlandense TaxID=345663 RepID=A0A101CE91_9FLAO|nr:TlpA disulfide reductase family protein [Chryseobacterium aquaticum]KUJ54619.1 thioredoxin [Chryseobacterium aquaticum subsp. greenlandense]